MQEFFSRVWWPARICGIGAIFFANVLFVFAKSENGKSFTLFQKKTVQTMLMDKKDDGSSSNLLAAWYLVFRPEK
jgi:hypothetical protein